MKKSRLLKSLFALALLVAATLGVFQVAPAEALSCPTRSGCESLGEVEISECLVGCGYDCNGQIQYGPPYRIVC
jgi:hypothetical protein